MQKEKIQKMNTGGFTHNKYSCNTCVRSYVNMRKANPSPGLKRIYHCAVSKKCIDFSMHIFKKDHVFATGERGYLQ